MLAGRGLRAGIRSTAGYVSRCGTIVRCRRSSTSTITASRKQLLHRERAGEFHRARQRRNGSGAGYLRSATREDRGTAYLGLGHYDCLLCHSGRNHLEQLTSMGRQRDTVGRGAYGRAFLRRTRLSAVPNTAQNESPLYQSTEITDVDTGAYNLNTTSGNRPNRTAVSERSGV